MLFDYRMVKEFEGKDFDFNDYVGVSGKESDLEPFTFPKKTFDSGIESSDGKMYNNGDLFTATQEFYNKVPYATRSDFARSLANKTVDIKNGEQYIYVIGYIFKVT